MRQREQSSNSNTLNSFLKSKEQRVKPVLEYINIYNVHILTEYKLSLIKRILSKEIISSWNKHKQI